MQIERILSRFEIPKEQGRIASVVDFDFERITIDLDQVSAWSEVPAKEKFFLKTGLDYRDRKIDKLQALAAWASEDGFDFEVMKIIEDDVWKDPEILLRAPANPIIQTFTYIATRLKKDVHIVTARNAGLYDVTYSWLHDYYPWIKPSNIHISPSLANSRYQFKAEEVAKLRPDYHMDDGIIDIKMILTTAPSVTPIHFPRKLDADTFKDEKSVIIVADFDKFANIMLKRSSVAQY